MSRGALALLVALALFAALVLWPGLMTPRVRRAASNSPSSWSKSQLRFCSAIRRRCNRLASRVTMPCNPASWLSR